MDGLYTGYVLPNAGTNPVQVYVPALDGAEVLGSFKTIGANTLNAMDATHLEDLRSKCKWYYLTQKLQSSNYYYSEKHGAGTTELTLPKGSQTLPNLGESPDYRQTSDTQISGKAIKSPSANPVENGITNSAILESSSGLTTEKVSGRPIGEFVTVSNWTKVIVALADHGATRLVLCSLPWLQDWNNIMSVAKMDRKDAPNSCNMRSNNVSVTCDGQNITVDNGTGKQVQGESSVSTQTQGDSREVKRGTSVSVQNGSSHSATDGSSTTVTGGHQETISGSSFQVVGQQSTMTDGRVQARNAANAEYVARLADSGNEKGYGFGAAASLSRLASRLKDVTVSVNPEKITPLEPTGCVLVDLTNLVVYMEDMLMQFTLKSIAHRVLTLIQSEIELMAAQFEETYQKIRDIGESIISHDLKSLTTNLQGPSQENSPKKRKQTKQDTVNAAAGRANGTNMKPWDDPRLRE